MHRLLFIGGLLLMCFRRVYDVDSHFRFVVHFTFRNVTGAESSASSVLLARCTQTTGNISSFGEVVLKHQIIEIVYCLSESFQNERNITVCVQ